MNHRAVQGRARKLRIAQVAPLIESVPPRLYGGTERVVSYLTEELVRRGHDVTLFASGDSKTSARLVPCSKSALRLAGIEDSIAPTLSMLERVYRSASDFDIVHFHVDYLHYPLTRREGITSLTTLHGRLDLPGLAEIYDEFRDIPLVSISDAQRAPLPQGSFRGTVHHGLPPDLYAFDDSPEDYLAFIGRVSKDKRLDLAIEIAGRAGLPLRVAAKVSRRGQGYFEREIVPLLQRADVEFLGEIGDEEKRAFLGKARALLFPIDWPEPFGVVMIEAMACGTPVITFRRGATPEVIEEGVTGFVADDVDAAVVAVGRISEISRARCRRAFEERFTVERMAEAYEGLYRAEIERARRIAASSSRASERFAQPTRGAGSR